MIEEKYERKIVTEEKNVLISSRIICDYCNRDIGNNEDYYEATTSHEDWGNDSVDSYESFDICDDCITKKFNEFIYENSSDTKRIEVKRA